MTLIAELLSAEPSSARAARRIVREVAGDLLPEEEVENLLLCTSEVVTNALEHGAPPIELLVADAGGCVRVEVRDGSPLRPRFGHQPGPTEVRGRGMLIVDHCADRWGVDDVGPGADAGKAVWFEFDC
jgi:anti-sigma regulatory factor (Ser/Thr protein kinase)